MAPSPSIAKPKTAASPAAARLARLRGSLGAEEPGARGLERVARNPGCQRLRALTMAGITPATAAAKIYGEPAREGQSPIALQTGDRFEAKLGEAGATRLLDLLHKRGRLLAGDTQVVNVAALVPGTNAAALARRRALTLSLLGMKLAGHPNAPHVILKPRLQVRLLGVDHDMEPDALIGSSKDAFYRVAEIKSYPDRGGKTDPADVKSACRQAAVGVIALRHALGLHLGVTSPSTMVPTVGDLVLRQPGSFYATLRSMALTGEIHSLERLLDEVPRNLTELEQLLSAVGPSATLDQPSVLDGITANYQPQCREFCALASVCKQQAVAASDPVILGAQAREELAAAGSLARALELLRATGVPPTTTEEAHLANRLREALAHYRTVVPHAR